VHVFGSRQRLPEIDWRFSKVITLENIWMGTARLVAQLLESAVVTIG
jgi:hypothetical protein